MNSSKIILTFAMASVALTSSSLAADNLSAEISRQNSQFRQAQRWQQINATAARRDSYRRDVNQSISRSYSAPRPVYTAPRPTFRSR